MNNKKVKYVVHSVREYRGGAEDVIKTWVRVDQRLYEGNAYAEMDSTVYEIDDFMDIHKIYKDIQDCMKAHNTNSFEYDSTIFDKYIERIKRELKAMV